MAVAKSTPDYREAALIRVRMPVTLAPMKGKRVVFPPELLRAIGARIHEARIAAGYGDNASEFAREIGMAPNSVYRLEAGKMEPKVPTLERISRVCRVSMDWLVRGETTAGATSALDAWRATPRGASASPGAVAFLRSLPLAGYAATPAFFDLALLAYETGLTVSGEEPETIAAAIKATETFRKN